MKPKLLFGWLAALAIGCQSEPGSRSGHEEPAEEERTIQMTIWATGYEIFAEYGVPVAGKATTFVTHVSDIDGGEPRRTGGMRLLFRQGEEQVEVARPEPNRAGIYLPEVEFPGAGEWEGRAVLEGEPAVGIELGIIRVYPSKEEAAAAATPEEPDGILFSKEQQWRTKTRIEAAERRRVVERIAVPARVASPPGGTARVTALVKGTVRAPEGGTVAALGDSVKAGEVLALIEPLFTDFTKELVEAEAEAIRTKAALDQARLAFERTRELEQLKARSPRELQEAEAAFLSAKAVHDAALAVQKVYRDSGIKFGEGGLMWEVRSPIEGFIEQTRAAAGEQVELGEELFTVLNSKVVRVEAQLGESSVPSAKASNGAVLELLSKEEPVEFGGGLRLIHAGKSIDPVTRTVPLVYEANNTNGFLRIGAMGTLWLETNVSTNAVALPKDAIVEEDGLPTAFVQLAGETFEKRDVVLGLRDGNWVEVRSGIQAGERVVVDGAYAILLSTKVASEAGHGHAH